MEKVNQPLVILDKLNINKHKISSTTFGDALESKARSPPSTPSTKGANIEFIKELKDALHEKNLLTVRTEKKVLDVLNEIEVTDRSKGVKRKRENAIFEILVSEKSYVTQLSTIIEFFMKPVKEKKLLSPSDYEVLFGIIQTIHTVNEALLKELYKGSTNVSQAFLKIAPYFKTYSLYAMEFKNKLDILQHARHDNTKFYDFLEMQESRPEVQNKLSALLITPIQRIPRYKLLLQQLYELTSPSDEDHENISKSLKAVEEAAEHINKVIESQENIQRLLEVQRCLKNNVPSIITPGRILLKEGILTQFDGHIGPSHKFYVILLNDIILFCKMKASTLRPNSLKCKKIFPLKHCTIIENVEKGCFQVHCMSEDIILYDRILSVTKEWIRCIEHSIENCLEKRKTLRKESSARRPVKRHNLNEYNDEGLCPERPMKKRRMTIEEDIKDCRYLVSPRRSFRSMTPSVLRDKHIQITPQKEPASFKIPEIPPAINGDIHNNSPNTDVMVFGKNNLNHSFTFRLKNVINNIGSSVINLFRFRR